MVALALAHRKYKFMGWSIKWLSQGELQLSNLLRGPNEMSWGLQPLLTALTAVYGMQRPGKTHSP